jgi:hypothetical protein
MHNIGQPNVEQEKPLAKGRRTLEERSSKARCQHERTNNRVSKARASLAYQS